MKKSLLILLLVIAGSLNFHVSANDTDKILWGIKATADLELPGKWHNDIHSVRMFHNGKGFTVGGVSNIYLGKNFYFEPGIFFFYSEYKYDLFLAYGGFNDGVKDPRLYKLGLEVPAVFGYTIGFSNKFAMEVFTGPQIRYGLGGDVMIKNKTLKEESLPIVGVWETQKRFDCDWKVGIGVPLNRFTVSVEADFGLINLLKKEIGMSFRENRVALGLKYFF